MQNFRDPLIEPMALAFATAKFTDWLNTHPCAEPAAQQKAFIEFFEGGLYLSVSYCNENPA